ncbi:MAG: endonuclease [Nitrospirae bacterium]|nr:MAG: endonuclease [Nitrospirota bacterium]
MSADNQQERLERLGFFIAGFVDGEGSFHVAVQKSDNVRLGWQVIPEFHVSQNQSRTVVLEMIRDQLGCGYIKPNHRMRINDQTNVFVVRNHHDLLNKVVPFFRKYPLFSCKNEDFKKLAVIVEMMSQDYHLNREGLKEILIIAFSMNNNGHYRKWQLNEILKALDSSETIRQNPIPIG